MQSAESKEIRKHIQKDKLNKDITIMQQRKEWEVYASGLSLPNNMILKYENIEGTNCLWISGSGTITKEIIFYIHGGGLTEGSPITHREFGCRLCQQTGRSVLIIDYSLAPEFPYPKALHEIQSIYKIMIKERFSFENIIWGGDSSGASLALSALIGLRDQNIPLPSKAFFISGLFDHSLSGKSYETKSAIDPFTSKDVLYHCNKLYSPDIPLDSPKISPLFNNLSNLPEILLQVGEDEILQSDSERIFEKIKSQNGRINLEVWDHMWHAWHLYIDSPEATQAITNIKSFLDK